MKSLLITYSNGDREISHMGENINEMLDGLVQGNFKSAWHAKDANGNYTILTNMTHVRSIEVIDESE